MQFNDISLPIPKIDLTFYRVLQPETQYKQQQTEKLCRNEKSLQQTEPDSLLRDREDSNSQNGLSGRHINIMLGMFLLIEHTKWALR